VTLGVHIRAREHNQGRKLGKTWKREKELCGLEANEDSNLPQGDKSLHMVGLVLP
jgi:hypothetical protein